MKQQTITIPDNMELVKISETEYKIVEKEKVFPKSWSEFCKNNPIQSKERFIAFNSAITAITKKTVPREERSDRGALPNEEYAEAILALCQLIQLRDCYRQGWKPNYNNTSETKHVIEFNGDRVKCESRWTSNTILSFQRLKIRDEFYNNFKDLIEKTKPLFM